MSIERFLLLWLCTQWTPAGDEEHDWWYDIRAYALEIP